MRLKNLFLLSLFILVSIGLNAQSEDTQRKYIAGGAINFGIQDDGLTYIGNNITSGDHFTFSSFLGRKINENWTLGFTGLFDYRKSSSNFASHDLGFGIFGRYIVNPSNALKIYFQSFASINQHVVSRSNENNYINDHIYYDLGIKTGLLYDITKRTRITMELGGIHYLWKNYKEIRRFSEVDASSRSFRGNFNPANIRLGIEFKF